MANPRNFGFATGRLTKDPVVFDNQDGSKKVIVTLALTNNFKNKDGETEAQFIDFQAFIGKGASMGGYGLIGKGDLIEVIYELRNNNWTGKDGVAHYDIVMHVTDMTMLESKAVTSARRGDGNAAPAVEAAPVAESVDLSDLLG